MFYGLGSDGTVGANKTSVKIIGEGTDRFAQGYFVLDSKKSGSVTVSHLRIASRPIRATYLIGQGQATFIACHQFHFLDRMDVLGRAAPGATFLLNSPWSADQVWDHLPVEVQREIIDKGLELWVVDAARVARDAGMGHRINTVMQPCFFALSGVLPRDQAIAAIKAWVEKAFSRRGEEVVARNFAAIDGALEALHKVEVPTGATSTRHRRPAVSEQAPDFVKRVTARMLEGNGDLLPVSALPVDGAFPTGTARWEKRSLAAEIPIWDPSICIDCGKCAIVCPHSTIRTKVFGPEALEGAPDGFASKDFRSRDLPGMKLTVQVAPDDCTGCGVCVEVCPAHSKEEVKHKAINMTPVDQFLERERERWDFFLELPELDHDAMAPDTVKGSQLRQPLFEFSGACGGCGETQYLKLISQLFGDRLLVANATGCSSIYGGNLPTTPWTVNAEGRGPAWANSLFEDNAEFGLGIRLATDFLLPSELRSGEPAEPKRPRRSSYGQGSTDSRPRSVHPWHRPVERGSWETKWTGRESLPSRAEKRRRMDRGNSSGAPTGRWVTTLTVDPFTASVRSTDSLGCRPPGNRTIGTASVMPHSCAPHADSFTSHNTGLPPTESRLASAPAT